MAKKVNQKQKTFIRCLIVTLACFLVSFIIYKSNGFEYFENKTYDLRMKSAAEFKVACDRISYIKIDQESVNWANNQYGWSWPWPREAYARIVDFVSAGNAKSIAFDILYTEPSIYGQADDEAFGKAESESGIVIQTLYIQETNEDEDSALGYALPPVPAIADNAAMLANITSSTDSDGVIRRGRLSYEFDEKVYPTLGTAPVYLQGEEDTLTELPVLSDGTVYLRYAKNLDEYYPYSAADILARYDAYKNGEEDVGLEEFEDQYVYIGVYGPGFFDICNTPVSNVLPGIGVHITTLDNYLTNSFMYKVPEVVNLLWMLFVSLLVGFFVSFSTLINKHLVSMGFMISGIIVTFTAAILIPYILFFNGIWLILVGPLFSIVLCLVVNIGLNLSIEGKHRRFIKNEFSKCAPKAIIDKLIDEPELTELGGEERDVSAIITDLQRFSSFSEILTPSELDSFLLQYLHTMSGIIKQNMGIIDKYVGDEIVAILGAPVPLENNAEKACISAIDIKKAERKFRNEIKEVAASNSLESVKTIINNLAETFLKDKSKLAELKSACEKIEANNVIIHTRIGINSGNMIVGFFGSDELRSYTMMGSNVNIAARLEGINKYYNTEGILISEATRDRLNNDFLVRKLDRVRVVNISQPIRIFELIDKGELVSECDIKYIKKWDIGFEKFENKEYLVAYNQFKELEKEKPDDGVLKHYLLLLEKYFLKGKYPTVSDPEDIIFDPETGVFSLKMK